MNPEILLYARPLERVALLKIAEEAHRYHEQRDENLARRIVNEWVLVQRRSARRH